ADAPVRARPDTIISLDLPAYQNDVLTALSRAGGLPGPGSDNTIIIQRHQAPAGAAQPVTPPGNSAAVPPRPAAAPSKGTTVAAPVGQVLVQVPIVSGSPQSFAGRGDEKSDGAGPSSAPSSRWQMFGATQLQAFETDGRPIDPKTLAERLQKMTVVLVAIDGR